MIYFKENSKKLFISITIKCLNIKSKHVISYYDMVLKVNVKIHIINDNRIQLIKPNAV